MHNQSSLPGRCPCLRSSLLLLGQSTNRHTIVCDSTEISVTDNLLSALRRLQELETPRLLWIDAICINQDDASEKADQIGIMRDIYKQAHHVLVWLGEATEGIERVWPLVENLSQTLKAKIELHDRRNYWELSKRARAKYSIPPPNDLGYRALGAFFDSPWSRRVWVVQEVVVASKIVFIRGDYKFPGASIIRAIVSILILRIDAHFSFHLVDELAVIVRERMAVTGLKLLSTMGRHRMYGATNPRDRIFALCGISTDFGPGKIDIKIDYSSSVEDVYIQSAKAILSHHRDLRLLRVPAPLSKPSRSRMPSWVPDWRVLEADTHIWLNEGEDQNSLEQPERHKWHAAKGSPASVAFDGNYLEIMGFIFERVIEIGVIHKAEKNNVVPTHENWMTMAGLRCSGKQSNDKSMLDSYYHTITTGSFFGESDTGKSAFRRYDRLLRQLGWLRSVGCTSSTFMTGPTVRALEVAVLAHDVSNQMRVAQNRRLVKTGSGHLGLAHGSVQVGDHIVICKGSSLPLIMRKERGKDWTLVGDSYIYGIMQGEALEEKKCHILRIT